MIWYEIRLPVFKQGDDLAYALSENGGDVVRGLLTQAEHYALASTQLIKLASHPRVAELTITADTHSIDVEGPQDLLDELIKRELIIKCNDEDNRQDHD
jgi:hypothetical protein